MRRALTILMLWLLPWVSIAQASFEAYTDAREVVLNSYFEVTFTLKNADGKDFSPPSFDNFVILSGPSQSMSRTIINGKVSREIGFSYTLQPKRSGRFTIGSASIKADGRTLRTNPLTVRVVEGKSNAPRDPAGQVFLQAELNTEEAVIGQQVLLDYKLYTAVNIDSYSILEESDYQGFFAQDLRRFDSPPIREVVNGVQYLTKVLKRVALFPQQAGVLKVAPLQLELAVLLEESDSRSGFLLNRPVKRVIVQTDEASLRVNALPENPPATFTGAVGDFDANFSLNRIEASTDDVLSLRLVISGNGDIKRVQPPSLMLADSFEMYDPKMLEETTFENTSGELTGRKEIEYFLLPKRPGTYQLQPSFAYYSPDSGKYVVLSPQTFEVTVSQGSQRASDVGLADGADPEQDIRYLKLNTNLHQKNGNFFGSTSFWVFTALPFLFLGGVILIKRIQNQRGDVDATQLKIKRARQEALRHLQVAEEHLKANESRAFYDEVSKALLGYVCDKLQIPRSALTKENVREKLHALKIDDQLVENFMRIIQACEVALFSGQDTPTAMNETYQQAVENISRMEEKLGR